MLWNILKECSLQAYIEGHTHFKTTLQIQLKTISLQGEHKKMIGVYD